MVEINDIICRKCVAFYIYFYHRHTTTRLQTRRSRSFLIHNIKNGNTFSTHLKL